MSPVRQRVHLLRRRLTAASVALFILLFGGITVQLASGHDPALSSTGTKAGVTQSTPATSSAGTTSSSAQQQASPSTLAPVTTSQL
jgi:hypothetical protein